MGFSKSYSAAASASEYIVCSGSPSATFCRVDPAWAEGLVEFRVPSSTGSALLSAEPLAGRYPLAATLSIASSATTIDLHLAHLVRCTPVTFG
jgi:hypothetical protein